MAPTATHNRRQQTPLNEVEFPTFTETLLTMMWWGAFLLGTSAHPALGLLVIGVWLWYKYKTWDSGEAIEPSQGSEYIIMQSIPLSDRDSIDDGVSSDAPQDSHTWRETGSESSDGPHEPGFTATTDDDHVATTEEQVPFDWYGDEDVPVQTVLDHIDTELDPETRHQIIRSVEKHRARGDAVDAADIRWVAEASEKLDLEGEHPF